MISQDLAQIVVLACVIKTNTQMLRDEFPNDMPYLWEKLAPIIESIESSASSIRQLAKEVQA